MLQENVWGGRKKKKKRLIIYFHLVEKNYYIRIITLERLASFVRFIVKKEEKKRKIASWETNYYTI